VVEKVTKRVQGWKQSLLSHSSRTCFIKAVAAAAPIYAMSSLLFPKNICSKIDALLSDFWWGKKEERLCTLKL
jgi:hypothetical protein